MSSLRSGSHLDAECVLCPLVLNCELTSAALPGIPLTSRTFAVSTLVVLAMCAGVALMFSSSSMRPDTLELLSSSKKGLGLKNADVQLLKVRCRSFSV